MIEQDRGRFARRSLAAIGALALAMIGTVAASGAAQAAEDDDVPTVTQVGNINPQAIGSVTVHKYQETGSSTKLNPAGPPPASGYTPLDKVQFSISKVTDIDLTTQAGWTTVAGLTVNPDGTITGHSMVPQAGPTETDGTGAVTFGNLGIGVYVVTEGADNGGHNITSKAAPFIVTVPLPNNNSWLYDVHVYPKNSVTSVDKTVTSPTSYGLGSTVTWPIKVNIPTLAPNTDFTSFSVSDVLDSRLEYVSYTLTAGVDPVPNVTPTVPAAGTAGGTFTAELPMDAAGQTFLRNHAGQDLMLTLTTKVVGIGDGDIVNDGANVTINDKTVHTPEPVTRWGDVIILKTDQGSPAKPLVGATFQVYAGACTVANNVATGSGSPISVTSGSPATTTSTFTTGPDGTTTIAGLWVGDDSTPANDVTSRTYCVIETGAPAGFNIKAPGGWDVTVNAGTSSEVDLTVDDPHKPPVELPLTGSTGTAIFVAGGLALILAAGGASLIASRRRQATEK